MSVTTTRYVWGVKVFLKETGLVQDTDIGLYVAAGVGQLRLVQYAVTAADTWKAGLINEGGIGEIGSSADFTLGGGVTKIDGMEISLTDIIGTTPLWKKLADAGISLAGCVCHIVEFDTTASPATETIIYRGIVETAPTWDIENYRIRVCEPYYKRDTLIGSLVDNSANGNYPNADDNAAGKLLPITFGEFKNNLDGDGNITRRGYIKAIKIASKETEWVASDSVNMTGISPSNRSLYSVTSYSATSGATAPTLRGRFAVSAATISDINAELADGYHYVVIVGGTNGGMYRKITGIGTTWAATAEANILLNSDFTTDLTSSDWFKIVSLRRGFVTDTWPCKNFLDINGAALTKNFEYYILDNNIYYRIPNLAYELESGSSNISLTINAEVFKDTPDKINLHVITPIDATTFEYIPTVTEMNDWGLTGYQKYKAGIFVKPTLTGAVVVTSDVLEDVPLTKSTNKTKADFSVFSYRRTTDTGAGAAPYMVAVCLKALTPNPPKDFEFDAVYIGIYTDNSWADVGTASVVKILYNYLFLKRFVGAVLTAGVPAWTGGADKIADNLPDKYYIDAVEPATYNNNYYKLRNTDLSSNPHSGYTHFTLTGLTSPNIYQQYKELFVGFLSQLSDTGAGSLVADIVHKLYEIAIMFHKEVEVDDYLLTSFQGRIFNATWGARKTAANLMESPIDILEHVNRLQNWTEEGATEAPGNAYAASALINTATTEGGFDAGELDTVKGFKAARQILDENEARSGRIKESLCKQFFLCSYTDTAGKECVNTIHRRTAAPATSITLSKILPDSLSSFEEMDVANVFCAPFVRYAYNSATDKYDGILRVIRPEAAAWSTDSGVMGGWATGFSGGEGEAAWNKCHALYNHYRVVTEAPSDMTDCQWIRSETDAKAYLDMWLEWMGVYLSTSNVATVARKRRFSFDIPYSLAMTIDTAHTPWFPSMRFSITLPHQTANVSLQCIVEEIKFNVNENRANVTAWCYDISEDIQYYVQDTYKTQAEGTVEADWQDSVQTKAEAPTNGNDVQDSM